MMKKAICFIVGVLLSLVLSSQSYNSYFNQFEIRSHYGITLPHHSHMKYFINNNVFIGEMNYSIKTDGSQPWQHTWRFPEIGVGYLMGGLGNINVLGFSQSVFGFFGVPIIQNDNFTFKYRLGTGVAYLSEKFDYRSNYYNVAIGSHLNAHLHFSILIDYKPFDFPLYINTGFAFNHFSNGAVETPNLGLNQISANLGVKYLYSIYNYSLPKRTIPYRYNKDAEFSIYYAVALKENSTYENKKYMIHSFVFDAASRITTKRSFGGGINLIADPSLKTLIGENYNGIHSIFRVGVHALQELYLTNDLSMILNVGSYIYNKYKPADKGILIYTKIGVRYTFSNQIFTNINIKTHLSTADYIEFGGGMRFKN